MKRYLPAALAGLTGCILLISLFPQYIDAARWGFQVDREAAIQRARALATSEGISTQNWRVLLDFSTDRKLEYYRRNHPADIEGASRSEITLKILFSSPDRKSHLLVETNPAGDIIGWELRGPFAGRDLIMTASRRIAETAFLKLAGKRSSAYRLTTENANTKEGLRFTWEPRIAGGQLQPAVDVVVGESRVVHAETHLNYSKDFESDWEKRNGSNAVWRLAFSVLLFTTLVGASILFTLGAIRRTLDHRFAFTFGFVSLFFAWLYFILTSSQGVRLDQTLDGGIAGITGAYVGIAGTGLMAWVLAGAGPFSSGALIPQWWSLRLLFSARMLSRPVGRSLVAGVLAGPALAAVPTVIAAFYPRVSWFGRSVADLIAPFPALSTLFDFPFHPTLLSYFGLLVPLALTRIPWRGVRFFTIALTGLIFFAGYEFHFRHLAPALILHSALSLVVSFAIFRRYDLLALLTAETTKGLTLSGTILLCQPSAALHMAGLWSFAVCGIELLIGIALILKGSEQISSDEAATRPLGEGIFAKRDVLKTEFNIAQRAQRDMLPEFAPPVAGFTIAAHCTPARDVGGDIYDFLPLSADRLAIAVGDVSGKGVPAALYMTLTKGLLVATTQEDLGLAEILGHANTHLYTVGRRKTFVTMAMAILDPAAKSLTHARAGHNPAVLRRAKTGVASFLNSRGVGLGITSSKIFNKTLAVETIQLEPGDFVVFYSDGLTEAMNESLEQFGEDRLIAVVESLGDLSADHARDRILMEATTFLDGVPPQDDLTLVVLRAN